MAPVTALYAGLHALLLLALIFPIIRARHRNRIGVGDGGLPELQRAIRVHGNAVEYVPIGLLLLLVLELNGGHAWLLYLAGAVLFVARVLHAWGFSHSGGASFGRTVGMVSTIGVVVVLALANLVVAF